MKTLAGPRATFLYDGDCAFCTSCARWIGRRIPTRAGIEPWQRADLAALGVSADAAAASVLWVDGDRVTAGPDGIADLLRDAGGVWRLCGAVLAFRPVRAVAWPVYRWVARHRDRMPGGTPACALPDRMGQTPGDR